jgi:xanthine dehydrogenase accessory factor
MKEFRDIVNFYENAGMKDRRVALVTVVRVIGSAYRGPGARMLLTDDGKWTGTVSGGCLEMAALRKSLQAIHKNQVQLVSFNSMDEKESYMDYGTGCNGIVDLLIEPIDHSAINNPVNVLRSCLAFKDTCVIATVIRSNNRELALPGQRMVLNPGKQFEHSSFAVRLQSLAENDMYEVLETRTSRVYTYVQEKSEVEVFIEIVQPSVNLLIFGSGTDVKPMVHLASFLGWQVSVIDKCIKQNHRTIFSEAGTIINCQARDVLKKINIAPLTAAVLMSHNYEYDLEVLQQLLPTKLSYIGIMGSQKKTERMFGDLSIPGPGNATCDPRIHTPVGLDIGAETAEEIAFSIISEIMATFTGGSGRPLKTRTGFIHKRNAHDDEVCKLVYTEFINQ